MVQAQLEVKVLEIHSRAEECLCLKQPMLVIRYFEILNIYNSVIDKHPISVFLSPVLCNVLPLLLLVSLYIFGPFTQYYRCNKRTITSLPQLNNQSCVLKMAQAQLEVKVLEIQPRAEEHLCLKQPMLVIRHFDIILNI